MQTTLGWLLVGVVAWYAGTALAFRFGRRVPGLRLLHERSGFADGPPSEVFWLWLATPILVCAAVCMGCHWLWLGAVRRSRRLTDWCGNRLTPPENRPGAGNPTQVEGRP